MSFQTGLSGLNAAGKNLDVIGNNIANSNTIGAKSSRVEFSAVVSASSGPSGGAGASSGIGVEIATISQQFSQGTINITGNNLDCAINGGGFFQLQLPDKSFAYTRDGQFKLDTKGNLITNAKASVLGFPTDASGVPLSTTPVPLTIPTGAPIAAKATSLIAATVNLDARAEIASAAVPPTPYTTYGTTLEAYDAQGVKTTVKLYFIKTAADAWDVTDGDPAAGGTTLTTLNFDNSGNVLALPNAVPITLASSNPNILTFPATIDLSQTTQYGTSFTVSDLTQDGYTAGTLTGVSISDQGIITTRYSNGQSQAKGQLALADFRNTQGLKPVGQGNWEETVSSGQPIPGSPKQGNFGSINSGALEASNVDLTAELINMMTAQRDYQANAQTIKTQDATLQTLVNLR
jgi:flagellar hook protein FlgE